MSPSASLVYPGCQWQLEKTGILDRLQTLLQNAHFADCSFRVGPDEHTAQDVNAHRLLLAAASPVFEAMLFGPLAETSATPIRVPDLRPEAFRSVLEYVYTDRLRPEGASHALAILYAANKYLIPSLAQLCRKYVVDNVTPQEALALHESALAIHEESLLEPCLSAAAKYPKEAFGDNPDFEPTTLCAFLQLERLNWSEEALVEATLHWASQRCQSLGINDSPGNRRQMLEDCGAIRLLRFGCLPRPQLERCALLSGLLSESEVASLPIQCPRGRMHLQIYHCNRKTLKRSFPVPGGMQLACIIRVLERPVTLSGIGLTTRLPPPLHQASSNNLIYLEDLTINVIDAHGESLTTKTFKETVEHNLLTVITFSAIRLQPDHPYTIEVTLNASQDTEYPVNILSQREINRGYIFEFLDLIRLSSNEFVERTNIGFIDSLIFSP